MRVACGFDATPAAQAAACAAATVARRLDAELTLVHALGRASRRRGRGGVAAGDRLAELRRTVDALAELTGARVRLRIEPGEPVAALRRVARATACDLLVVGLAARPRRAALAPGVARRLAAAPPCPLALVPEDASVQRPDRIVAGCHGATASSAATAFAGRMAARLGVPLTLVEEVAGDDRPAAPTGWERYDAPRRHRRLARAAAGRRPLPIELVERAGGAAATVAPAASADAAAWLVVAAPVRRRRWPLGAPAACRLAAAAARPVVVAPPGPAGAVGAARAAAGAAGARRSR